MIYSDIEGKLHSLESQMRSGDNKSANEYLTLLQNYCNTIVRHSSYSSWLTPDRLDDMTQDIATIRWGKGKGEAARKFSSDIHNYLSQKIRAEKKLVTTDIDFEHEVASSDENDPDKQSLISTGKFDSTSDELRYFLADEPEIHYEWQIFIHRMLLNKYLYGVAAPRYSKMDLEAGADFFKEKNGDIGKLILHELAIKEKAAKISHGKNADKETLLIEILYRTHAHCRNQLSAFPHFYDKLCSEIFTGAALVLSAPLTRIRKNENMSPRHLSNLATKMFNQSSLLQEDEFLVKEINSHYLVGEALARLRYKISAFQKEKRRKSKAQAGREYIDDLLKAVFRSRFMHRPDILPESISIICDDYARRTSEEALVELGEVAVPAILSRLETEDGDSHPMTLFGILARMRGRAIDAVPYLVNYLKRFNNGNTLESDPVVESARLALKRIQNN